MFIMGRGREVRKRIETSLCVPSQKVLGEKKETLLQMIRKVGNTEQRKVNDILHKISRARERKKEKERELVNIAKQNNACIFCLVT
ncbi:hypothetical protein Ngar_c01120 [Candidatus Nitrososphaera gargensis Ga9.2]|uniref:Uncharacterized protein n=1 Tax=Nitrososphaera gargensis (strain Ga9.2) TaxID=1237085 RepID=K0IGX1_NITGG|nr:hypothetical protein [Candidatus Nitrososphaera gargensis]AFU57062.1 hypothetical protein Ngar_c01120 [Candidatus Nitrososphaera gargensis Ga9.2]